MSKPCLDDVIATKNKIVIFTKIRVVILSEAKDRMLPRRNPPNPYSRAAL
jgi:hypothetical protein